MSFQSESGPGGPGGRQLFPGASRTSNKQSVWSGRGQEPCSNGRPSGVSAIPSVSWAASTQGLCAPSAFTGNEERTVSPGGAGDRRDPGQACGRGVHPPQSSHGREKCERRRSRTKSSVSLEKKIVPIFGEKKKIHFFFLSKNTFSFQHLFGAISFKRCIIFLLYSCQQKNNTWAKALLVLQGQDFRKLTFSEEKRASLASQTNPASGLIRSGPHLPRRQWPPLPGGEPRRRRLGAPAHQRASQGQTLGEGYPDVQLAVQERQLVVSLPKTLRKGQSKPQLCTRTCKYVS